HEADRDLLEVALRAPLGGRHVLGEAVGAELEAFDELAEAPLEALRHAEHQATGALAVRRARRARRERPDVGRPERGGGAEPAHDELVGLHLPERRERDLLVLLARELLLLEELAERSPERAVEAVEGRAGVLLLLRPTESRNADDHEV